MEAAHPEAVARRRVEEETQTALATSELQQLLGRKSLLNDPLWLCTAVPAVAQVRVASLTKKSLLSSVHSDTESRTCMVVKLAYATTKEREPPRHGRVAPLYRRAVKI